MVGRLESPELGYFPPQNLPRRFQAPGGLTQLLWTSQSISILAFKASLSSILFSSRRFECSGYWDSHLSPCLTCQVQEMGNPFKRLVLKVSDGPSLSLARAPRSIFLSLVPPKASKSTTKLQAAVEIKYSSNFHIYL
jgi:hypothetical protein